MQENDNVLAPAAARAFYDRFGNKQEKQGFYEHPPVNDLLAHVEFQDIRRVFEFGCGTGELAVRLLHGYLPPSSAYRGCGVSSTMIEIAKSRLETYSDRATVILSDGSVDFPLSDLSVDCIVSTYTLDLLSKMNIQRFFTEADRVSKPGGRVC